MDNHIILVEKVPSMENFFQGFELEDMSVISRTPVNINSKGPGKITAEPRIALLIITASGPIPYSSNKAIPWSYGDDAYYHGVKKEPLVVESGNTEVTDSNVDNIVGTNKVTRSGRGFSPEISPKIVSTPLVILANTRVATPTITPVVIPATE